MRIERNISTDVLDVNIKLLGENVDIGWHSTVWADEVGDNTRVGRFVEIQEGVKIGKNCKIGSYTFIPEGVEILDDVFIGPRVTFTNDRKIHWPEKGDWKPEPTKVFNGVKIGAGAVIVSPVMIGEKAIVAAGAVVTKSVGPMEIVGGNPARVIGKVWSDGSITTKIHSVSGSENS